MDLCIVRGTGVLWVNGMAGNGMGDWCIVGDMAENGMGDWCIRGDMAGNGENTSVFMVIWQEMALVYIDDVAGNVKSVLWVIWKETVMWTGVFG